MNKKITVGIPCYSSVSPETLDDYMRFYFYLGRRYSEYDFLLAIKSKTEQFRARNAIVKAALQMGSDFLLMLDDDHVIDTEETSFQPSIRYEFLRRQIKKLEESPEHGIAGTLYFQRGGDCRPVAMLNHNDGGFRWIRDDEITKSWQEVSVVGGGCMLIKCEVFDKIPSPWFEAELDLGTDIQICKKAKDAGYKIFLDSSQVIGHVMHRREIVTENNRHRIFSETFGSGAPIEGLMASWQQESALAMYVADALDYLKLSMHELELQAIVYQTKQEKFNDFDDKRDFYRSLGKEQLCRQVWFHCLDSKVQEFGQLLKLFRFHQPYYGLDFGCGSAPLGYEIAARGHRVDFIDLDGAGAYEFLKWRVKKNGIRTAGFKWGGPYDYAMMMDSLEHIEDWRGILDKIIQSLKPNGYILTNYFMLTDDLNLEHISMDQEAVKNYLVEHGVYPRNEILWYKQEEVYKNDHVCTDKILPPEERPISGAGLVHG